MSRIGKKGIAIPEKTEITVTGETVVVKGPKGTLTRVFKPDVSIVVGEKNVEFTPRHDTLLTRALYGTYASHLKNMIEGVTTGFQKKLLIEGIGYKAEVKGTSLVMNLGFSHQISMPIPEGLKVTSEKGVITVSGSDAEIVGQFAANVRAYKEPEPYKGKGIRYHDEIIRRKQGKKTA